MRYSEIIEAAQISRAANEAEKRRMAREQLAAADRKRANAARNYQDDLEATHSAAQQAKAKLRALANRLIFAATAVPLVCCDPKLHYMNDRH